MNIQSWIIAGLIVGSLAAILLVVAGALNEGDAIAAVIAFTCAAILLVAKRWIARPRAV